MITSPANNGQNNVYPPLPLRIFANIKSPIYNPVKIKLRYIMIKYNARRIKVTGMVTINTENMPNAIGVAIKNTNPIPVFRGKCVEA